MSEDVFEGQKDIRIVRRIEDQEFLARAKKKLKFERDVDFIALCASIGLYRSRLLEREEKEEFPSLRKLTNIMTFDERWLFDFIILTYLDIEKERLKEFECYFYTGFKILQDWFEKNDGNMTSTIERFTSLFGDLIVSQKQG